MCACVDMVVPNRVYSRVHDRVYNDRVYDCVCPHHNREPNRVHDRAYECLNGSRYDCV